MMKSGELKEKIEIQKSEKKLNSGIMKEVFITVYTLRAKKKSINTKEYINNNSYSSSNIIKFICYKRNINTEMYVLYKNDRYNIRNIFEFEDDMYIEITCEKVK